MEKENTTHHQVDLYYYVQIDSNAQLFPIRLSVHGTTEQLEQAIAECDQENFHYGKYSRPNCHEVGIRPHIQSNPCSLVLAVQSLQSSPCKTVTV